ncbi:MAG: CinA family protein [Euryarchaeota archaeon]|nr:CinA family protein [Euryarchaeota archaeon]
MLEIDLLEKLVRAGLTLALAESCTGGRIGDRITDVPGSSERFMGGVIAYSNDSKVKLLGVSPDTLKAHGAVSAECAEEMAAGAAKAFSADIGLSVTGIAGPGGATPQKPVGLVFVGLCWKRDRRSFRFVFTGDREQVKAQAVERALHLVLDYLP